MICSTYPGPAQYSYHARFSFASIVSSLILIITKLLDHTYIKPIRNGLIVSDMPPVTSLLTWHAPADCPPVVVEKSRGENEASPIPKLYHHDLLVYIMSIVQTTEMHDRRMPSFSPICCHAVVKKLL